jgi:Ca2+-binding EF-hand superfamily protein
MVEPTDSAASEGIDAHWEQREFVKNHAETRAGVRLYWDLMVMESVRFGGNGCDVNREGYRNFHLRVSKSLEARFDMATAEAVANKDWAEDITAFSGDSTDLIWLEEVKKKFREVTQETVNKQGWAALFARYDSDGSGDIDFDEFAAAARTDCGIAPGVIADEELRELFSQADDDGSGEVDSTEFCAWIMKADNGGAASPTAGRMREVKEQFRAATEPVVTKIGWAAVFASYDTDGSGALDKEEFIGAVRKDCDLNEKVLSDADLGKMFDAVDDDGSGEIDCDEFEQLLTSDALAQDMTFEVFYEAMFQLVDLWTSDPPEVSNYQVFLTKMLKNITKSTGEGKMTLRDLTTLYDDTGVLMYELAPVDEITSFVDEGSGEVEIQGVEINEDMLGAETPPPREPTPEPEPEPEVVLPADPQPAEPEWIPTEVVGSEVKARLPTPQKAPARDYAAEEAARLAREADEEAKRLAEAEEEERRREAARLAREAAEAAEAERRRMEAERRARIAADVTLPLPRSQRAGKARREAVGRRQEELRAQQEEHCRALEQMASERPAWWAQVDRLMGNLTQLDIAKLDSKLLGKFATWADAKILVQALVRAICSATADIERNPSKGADPNEAVALAVAKELRQNGEMAGLLRLIIADADEPSALALPADVAAANHVVGARLLAWLQRILAAHLEASELPQSLRTSQRFVDNYPLGASVLPTLSTVPRAVVTPGTVKRRQVNAKKEELWKEAQDCRTKRSKLRPRLRRVENTGSRAPDIATARRKLQSLSYSKAGQDPMQLFRQYDHDNSGELDFTEFSGAVRKGGQMTPAMISDAELAALFAEVDGDGSGDVSIEELQAFVWGGDGGATSARGKKAKVAQVKLPTVNANRTKAGLSDKPLPRYMQPRPPPAAAAREAAAALPDDPPAHVAAYIRQESTTEYDEDPAVYRQPVEAHVPRPPTGSKLPPMHASGARLQDQRVTFSRERPIVRRIASAISGPRRGGGTPGRWGAPGMVKPRTPVFSVGRRFLPPNSVDWSKSISARF